MKNKILGGRAAPRQVHASNTGSSGKANPAFSDIPIFDDVGSIGMPGLAPLGYNRHSHNEESKSGWGGEGKDSSETHREEHKSGNTPLRERKPNDFNSNANHNAANVFSGGKRSRVQRELADDVTEILQDKENVPKIPQATTHHNIVQVEQPFGSSPMKKARKVVQFSSPSDRDNNTTHSPDSGEHKEHSPTPAHAGGGGGANDARFATDRREGDKAANPPLSSNGVPSSSGTRMGNAAVWAEGTPLKHSYEYTADRCVCVCIYICICVCVCVSVCACVSPLYSQVYAH